MQVRAGSAGLGRAGGVHPWKSRPPVVLWAVGVPGRDRDAAVHLETACGLDTGKAKSQRFGNTVGFYQTSKSFVRTSEAWDIKKVSCVGCVNYVVGLVSENFNKIDFVDTNAFVHRCVLLNYNSVRNVGMICRNRFPDQVY